MERTHVQAQECGKCKVAHPLLLAIAKWQSGKQSGTHTILCLTCATRLYLELTARSNSEDGKKAADYLRSIARCFDAWRIQRKESDRRKVIQKALKDDEENMRRFSKSLTGSVLVGEQSSADKGSFHSIAGIVDDPGTHCMCKIQTVFAPNNISFPPKPVLVEVLMGVRGSKAEDRIWNDFVQALVRTLRQAVLKLTTTQGQKSSSAQERERLNKVLETLGLLFTAFRRRSTSVHFRHILRVSGESGEGKRLLGKKLTLT